VRRRRPHASRRGPRPTASARPQSAHKDISHRLGGAARPATPRPPAHPARQRRRRRPCAPRSSPTVAPSPAVEHTASPSDVRTKTRHSSGGEAMAAGPGVAAGERARPSTAGGARHCTPENGRPTPRRRRWPTGRAMHPATECTVRLRVGAGARGRGVERTRARARAAARRAPTPTRPLPPHCRTPALSLTASRWPRAAPCTGSPARTSPARTRSSSREAACPSRRPTWHRGR